LPFSFPPIHLSSKSPIVPVANPAGDFAADLLADQIALARRGQVLSDFVADQITLLIESLF